MILDIEEIRDKDNETSLKEGGGIEMSTTVLSIYAMLALFALNTYRESAKIAKIVEKMIVVALVFVSQRHLLEVRRLH